VRRGRFGPFLGCTGYPECKGIKKLPKTPPETPTEDDGS
jgi:DNA topoisomerase-1